MQSLIAQLDSLVVAAMRSALGGAAPADPQIRAAVDPRFGDYQSNAAMSLAKTLGEKPRDVAQRIVDALPPQAAGLFDPPQIAGPGFINFRLRTAFLESALAAIPGASEPDRLGIAPVPPAQRQTVVVDYSSPNVAKEMHVGHLRSTIIGDSIARVLAFQGHHVIRQNHLGDWGTQFGMVILAMWHLCMAERRGEDPAVFDQWTAQITDASRKDAATRRDILAAFCARHQQDLDGDPDGRAFHAFLRGYSPRLDRLLAAYRFVNALEEAAEGVNLHVVDRRSDRRVPLSSISNRVAAMLQGAEGESEQERQAWEKAKDATLVECDLIYRRLGVMLTSADVCGESFYHDMLPGIVQEVQLALEHPTGPPDGLRAVCRRDAGALCIFLEKPDGSPAFRGPQGDPLPMIIQKSDGAYLYATTDLAAALYRLAHHERHAIPLRSRALADALARKEYGGLGADRVLYVVGATQKLHFEMLFPTIYALGWTFRSDGRRARLEHVSFGAVLGGDRKLLRTRSGDIVRLRDLLDEAVQRAEAQVRQAEADPDKRRGFDDAEISRIAETVGIAAVKYADLSQNRSTDYVFNWDKMLALQGNTAPYMLYACARIRSIYRKAVEERKFVGDLASAPIRLTEPPERALALSILRFAETIDTVGENLMPSFLCDYLYDLAGRFMTFYESCPVLAAPDEATVASRLRLCDLTARTLTVGLDLLGIPTLERM